MSDNDVTSLFRDHGGVIHPGVNVVINTTGQPEFMHDPRDFRYRNEQVGDDE